MRRHRPLADRGDPGIRLRPLPPRRDPRPLLRPTALFPAQWLARIATAVLPGTGQDPMLLLQKDEDPEGGYPITLESGESVGLFQYFDEKLVDAMNVAVHLLTSPQALAYLLEAAGAAPLERCGAILEEWADGDEEDGKGEAG